jgi:hypothetical protein
MSSTIYDVVKAKKVAQLPFGCGRADISPNIQL